jgi:c-di-GMP-binding flagellar brake protein YcgR
MTHQGWIERRQYERVNLSVRVTYRFVPFHELHEELDRKPYKDWTADRLDELARKSTVLNAVTKDISVGGMALVGPQEFPPEMALEIKLYLPSFPSPVKILADVVSRQAEIPGLSGTNYKAGIKILAINSEDVVKLDMFLLSEKLRKQNG